MTLETFPEVLYFTELLRTDLELLGNGQFQETGIVFKKEICFLDIIDIKIKRFGSVEIMSRLKIN